MRVKAKQIGLIWLVAIALWSCGEGGRRKIPVEVFFSSPEKQDFRLSPDGQYIAYLQNYKELKNIYVMDVATQKSRRITSETDRGVGYHFWADNEEIIFLKDWKPDDSLRLYAVNREMPAVRNLLPPSAMRMRWVGPDRVWNDELLISLNKRDSSVFDVYRLHIRDCKMEMIARNPGNIARWFTDLSGQLRLAIASDGETETLLYRDKEESAFRPVLSNNFKTSVIPLGFSREHKDHIFAISNAGRDKLAMVEIDLATGEEVRTIFRHDDVDVSETGYSGIHGKILYAAYDTWRTERHFIDPKMRQVYGNISGQLDGYEIELLESDSAQNRFIVATYTDRDPGSVYFYDAAENRLLKLADNNPALRDTELSPMKPISYTSRDGKTIHGYLTLPAGSSGRRMPVIVMPHNGPWKRNVWEFNTEVQFFASRGYAVFQMNYRGSLGYGKEFWTAGFREWGGDMQNDITDGVRWLIEEGVADPQRIGIYGFSFGGFCALHGVSFNSDLYACAAAYSGITNLFTFFKEIPPYYKPYQRMYFEMVGNPEKDADLFRSISPVFHADKIRKPVFLAQGGKDSRNSVNETNQFVREIRNRKVPITYLLKDEEGHSFKKGAHRLEFYSKLEEFFDTHLKK